MIIKSKSKTRAKQRKGAVANWKRVGKVTINALKKRGMTGEELRCLMWGRESITTPVKVKKSTMDLINPEIPGNNCFGGALSSALDVMAFTCDIDQEAAAQRALEPINEIPQPQNKNVPLTSDGSNTGVSMFGALNQLADSQGINSVTAVPMISTAPATTNLARPTTIPTTTTPGISTVPATTTTAIQTVTRPISMITSTTNILPNKQMLDMFVDPMRELIHQSINKTCDPNLLLNYANQATNLQNFEIIPIQKCEASISNLAGVFAGTEAVVKKLEVTVKRKSSFMDASDSDNMENTILGRLSRTRRAISANIRNISARSKGSTRKLLTDSRSPSISSLDSQLNANYDQVKPDDDQLDYAMERMTMIKESLKQTIINNTEDTLKPIYNLCPPESTHQEESSERISSSDEDIKKYTKKSRNRSKTAKTNRVTPAVDVNQRRGTSAEQKVVSAEPESPPNPLQPWSVQAISNMNTILAWENEVNSE